MTNPPSSVKVCIMHRWRMCMCQHKHMRNAKTTEGTVQLICSIMDSQLNLAAEQVSTCMPVATFCRMRSLPCNASGTCHPTQTPTDQALPFSIPLIRQPILMCQPS